MADKEKEIKLEDLKNVAGGAVERLTCKECGSTGTSAEWLKNNCCPKCGAKLGLGLGLGLGNQLGLN